MKNGHQHRSKFGMLFEWPFSGSWKPTWLPKPSQNASKIDAKSMKIYIEIDQNFVCFLSGLLVALGGQHGRKSSQKVPGGVRKVLPVLGLGGVLGGSWGLLGPKRPLEPPKTVSSPKTGPKNRPPGAMLGGFLGHVGLQEPPKGHSKSIQNFDRFRYPFSIDF